ncbi:copper chaperone PCu(A)C [Nevskia sp.]|uniref:copper chaperone PCu(A)C n=1 Tax=Nevskia sp. TaxID=1929292 RepID=UPI0025FEFB9B|nr:copper chaperone PCu(A)C [Nevskia sp.]
MNPILDRRSLLRAAATLVAVTTVPAAWACEFDADTLTVTHPWTRATAADAAFAVVSMKFSNVLAADRLIGVITPVASGAELGTPDGPQALAFDLLPGRNAELVEGSVHLRLTGLRQPLELGRAYPMKLVFERGGIVHAQLNVDFPAA